MFVKIGRGWSTGLKFRYEVDSQKTKTKTYIVPENPTTERIVSQSSLSQGPTVVYSFGGCKISIVCGN